MTKQFTLTLKEQLQRIEKYYPEDFYPIGDVTRFRSVMIFIGVNGFSFLLNNLGGIDRFLTMDEARTRIEQNPERYPMTINYDV
jgi:hypothetical protein